MLRMLTPEGGCSVGRRLELNLGEIIRALCKIGEFIAFISVYEYAG